MAEPLIWTSPYLFSFSSHCEPPKTRGGGLVSFLFSRRLVIKRITRLRKAKKKFYLNSPENEAAEIISSFGFNFSKRGYPDFTVYNEDGTIYGFVEVKPDEEAKLKDAQATFFDFCVKRNIPCIRWCPSDGKEKIEEFIKGKEHAL